MSTAVLLSDDPRRQVPSVWQHGLSGFSGGEFHIERNGDVTLKYVTVPVEAGAMELVPVPAPNTANARVHSVEKIAGIFTGETHRAVLAAVNGGFFDMATGLPIGFLLRNGDMEFFNMPQGFPRSMVGFGRTISIVSPKEMPKVFLKTRFGKLAVHHINVPGGRDAFGLFTSRYQRTVQWPSGSVALLAERAGLTPQRYRMVSRVQGSACRVPADHILIVLQGASRAYASALPVGSTLRVGWTLPERWQNQKIVHGLLAGPRLLQKGKIHVTATEERLAQSKSPDRVALGVMPEGQVILLWGHRDASRNLDFELLANILEKLGACEAIALDGGRSRALLAQTQSSSYLTDRYFEGGRPVANAVVVALRQPQA